MNAPIAHPVMVTKVVTQKEDEDKFMQVTSLKQLVDGKTDKASRCRFSVNAMCPNPLEENKTNDFTQYLKIYNTNSGACRGLKSKTDKPKKDEKLCFFI